MEETQVAETGANAARRRQKRTTNACLLCRKRKVRCSGREPCENCIRHSVDCQFETESRKVVVSETYLRELKRKIAALEGDEEPLRRVRRRGSHANVRELEDTSGDLSVRSTSEQPDYPQPPGEDDNLTNPLTAESSRYMTDTRGKSFYLGHSSTWAFSQQVMRFLQDHVDTSELGKYPIYVDFNAFNFDKARPWPREPPSTKGLPAMDYAVYLTNTVKFHMSPLFHVFEEELFLPCLREFYANPKAYVASSPLWYLQFLLVMAFGKAFLTHPDSTGDRTPPGSDLFIRAITLMPDAAGMNQDPLLSMEVLCLLSIYLQALGRRLDAYAYSGQAVRMAIAKGLHSEPSPIVMDERTCERRRKLWWTIYIIDRRFTSQIGAPVAIQDEDITVAPPKAPGSRKASPLNINASLARILTDVVRTVYGVNRRPGVSFLKAVQMVLKSIVNAGSELGEGHELDLDDTSSSISRISASLNLAYHQCIILTLRPLLLYYVQKRFRRDTSASAAKSTPLTPSFTHHIQSLLTACADSAKKVLTILSALLEQGLLDCFLPFDLDSLFSSATALLLMDAIVPARRNPDGSYMATTRRLLDAMVLRGNQLATYRVKELEHMEKLFSIAGRPDVFPGASASDQAPPSSDAACADRREQLAERAPAEASQQQSAPPFDWAQGLDLDFGQNGIAPDQIISAAELLDLDFPAFDGHTTLNDQWVPFYGDA
ncbi:fungal-specific transcription factor domain-containing protein [Macrophomina phaseolina]|uniref:Fungal-specific transcription factor domain-containing protein n=1 Tax=Macrophomina phaseolina TaxID=35725 RepID=A0ABQ8GD47_9PEZI|nr:fungal-specific transcription factor domain-containing protein [Macrophomina phaseolina]